MAYLIQMANETRVLYSQDCPICRFEVGQYRKQAFAKARPCGLMICPRSPIGG